MKRDGPRAPTAVHGPLRITYHPNEKANVTADCLEAKGFRTFIRIHSLLKSECLSANIKLTLHKELIRQLMTYACPAWELAVHTYLLKLQHMEKMFSAPLKIFQGAHRSVICTRLSTFRMYTIT
jgi:hypothetical protein